MSAVHLDLVALRRNYYAVAQHIAFFIGLTHKLRENENVVDYELRPAVGGIVFSHVPRELTGENIAVGRALLADWVVAQGIRQLIESFEGVLLDLYQFGLFALVRNQALDPGKAATMLKQFDRDGLKKKLQFMEKHLGIGLPETNRFDALAKARNCLTHRGGVVAADDCNHNATSLRIVWMGLDAVFARPDETVVPAVPGSIAPEGSRLEVRVVERFREFPVGARIALTDQDLSELIMLFTDGVGLIAQLSETRFRELGALVAEDLAAAAEAARLAADGS